MDLKRLCEEEIDLSKLSYREKGHFFTPTETAKRCIEVTKQVLEQNGFSFEEYTCLEPSAGNGSFSDLPQQRGYGILVEDKKFCSKIENIVWKKVAFYSTNDALNLRQSLIIEAIND